MVPERSRLSRLNDLRLSTTVAGWRVRPLLWGWDARKTIRIDRHAHQAWEAVLVVGGHGWYELRGDRQPLARGDLIVTRPGEAHAIRLDRRRPLAIIYVRFALAAAGNDRLGLAGRLADPAAPALLSDPGLEAVFDLLAEELGEGRPLALEPLVQGLFVRILRRWAGAARTADDPLLAAERCIEANLHRPLAVAAIARAAGLGGKALGRLAQERWGRSPLQEVLARRLARARQLLLEERTLAETAALIGYPDTRHFIAAFRRHHGITPWRWQQGQLGRR